MGIDVIFRCIFARIVVDNFKVVFKMLSYGHVNSPIAQGLCMGAASHAVGASTVLAYSSKYGAFASLGITLNGIFTALLTPIVLRLMRII